MTVFDDQRLTQEVLERFANTPDPRRKQLVTAIVRHLHALVREVEPTFDEWRFAIDYLTAVGQTCTKDRQEFILLSDVFGVSMLVDAVIHRKAHGATPTTVLGPFFVENAPRFEQGADISGGSPGEPLFVDVKVSATGGAALSAAVVDVWHSDSDGFYDVQYENRGDQSKLRGTFTSDGEGRVRFWSILPTPYPIPYDGPVGDLLTATARHPWRPAHLHFKISAPGHETLVTHLFVKGSPYLESDAVFGVKDALICEYPQHEPGRAPDGRVLDKRWRSLRYDFALERV